MALGNPFKLLQKLERKPQMVNADVLKGHMTDEDRKLLQTIGISAGQLFEKMHADVAVNYDRARFYNEITRAIEHWMIGPAIELYADYASNFSHLHNASVWITSENPTYQRTLTKLLDEMGVEEKIFDWAWNTAAFGDLFVRVKGMPGIGIVSINDDDHPLNVSRIDYNGCLVGFFDTPQGETQGTPSTLIPPWEIVHFRILGAKRKRPQFGDSTYSEFRANYLMTGADNKQVTSRYGTSIIINSLSAYKRLRLAEDSLLMARLTRGLIRYIWKLKVDSTNQESVAELITQLVGQLKKARALDTQSGSPNFDSKFGPLSAIEDMLIPVWGDTGDLTYDKIGGEVDIRWIADIEELRNQLACTLRVPLSVLGGYVEEASGALGAQAIEKLSIEFAHTARRLQRALKTGIKRLCQIHLAYLNMDPDPRLFEVCMTETSTAEEETIKDTLDTGADVIQKMLDLAEQCDENVDKVKVFNYLNQKLLKLDDFDLNDFRKPVDQIKKAEEEAAALAAAERGAEGEAGGESEEEMERGGIPAGGLSPEAAAAEPFPEMPESRNILRELVETKEDEEEYIPIRDLDLISFLPINENCAVGKLLKDSRMEIWESTYKDVTVKMAEPVTAK